MFRRILFWCHLTVGISTGIVVLIMSVTGVALTYQKQMTERADRAYWPVSAHPDDREANEELSVAAIVTRAQEVFPAERPTSIRFYSDPDAPAVVAMGREPVYVDRYTGETGTGTAQPIRTFFRVMTDWHRWLADDSRTLGRAITGASNLAFLFIVFSGMYLWIPRRWSLHSLRSITWFRSGLDSKARDFNWHNVFGFWTAIPLVLVVASGVVISYPWASNLVYTLSGTEAPARGGRGRGEATERVEEARLSLGGLDRLLDHAEAKVPRWRTINLTLPAEGASDVSFAIDESFGGQPQSRSTLVLDRHSGRVLRFDTFADQNAGQRARSWLRFVHTGEYYGVVGQTIAGIASLAGVFLVYTGFSLSLRRFGAWRRRKREMV